MIDPTPNEQHAIENGGSMAGEYLESIGKTDLAVLTADEWSTFCQAMIAGYCDSLRSLAAQDAAALAKTNPMPLGALT